jgi:uncharacterized membrane protein (TIGR02234 family)
MTPGRIRLLCFALLVLEAAGLLLAWSQTWFTFGLLRENVVVGGDVAAGALPPLALVSLALILALALAGMGFRIVLGALQALVGVGAVLSTAFALSQPVAVSAPAISQAIGVTGRRTAEYVSTIQTSPWPAVAIAAGCLGALTGVIIAATARAWPVAGRRFSRTRTQAEGGATPDVAGDPVREWDALSGGQDPTRRDPAPGDEDSGPTP